MLDSVPLQLDKGRGETAVLFTLRLWRGGNPVLEEAWCPKASSWHWTLGSGNCPAEGFWLQMVKRQYEDAQIS